MTELVPLETLFDVALGVEVRLPPDLTSLYGRLAMRSPRGRPAVVGNFVTSLDGVVSLNAPGHDSGGDISGFNRHDRMVMGLLRAVADAVIIGAGTLQAAPGRLWTAQFIFPPLASAYEQLRVAMGKVGPPVNVVVSGRGEIDLEQRVFQSAEVPTLIVTTTTGAQRLRERGLPASVQVTAATDEDSIGAGEILEAVGRVRASDIILIEGGPHLIGDFFADGLIDDLFLTLAPQIAGRDGPPERPGLVSGRTFAPEHPMWGKLVVVKRADSHLFLRYSFGEDT